MHDRGDIDPRIATTARAVVRRHGGSPLTGLPGFWERLVTEVLAARDRLAAAEGPAPTVTDIAAEAAPAMSGSPVILSDRLWNGIVATTLSEHDAPTGLGNPMPVPAAWHAMLAERTGAYRAGRPPRGH